MTLPTKNGHPWTSLVKFSEPVKTEFLTRLKNVWDNEDWGDNYQNNRRSPDQLAIYPCTRKITWSPKIDSDNEIFAQLVNDIADYVKKFFPDEMMLLWAEMTLLTPYGMIPWHHDRMAEGISSSRVMIQFTENQNIQNFFASWKDNTPTDNPNFNVNPYLGNDIYQLEMLPGNYYIFNHRIPHSTRSLSSKPRGLVMLEMIPKDKYDENWGIEYGSITEFEKTKILPPQF